MVSHRQTHKPLFTKASLALSVALASLPLAAQEKSAVGVTLAARGDVAATDLVDLEERALRRRSDVFNVDRVTTGEGARAQIRMEDDAVLSLRAGSELVIAEYEYNADTGEGRAIMELVSGGLRTLSGQISPDAPGSEYELRTSAGSIGIRGTHYEVVIVGPDTLMGVWDGNIDVNPPSGDPFSLGQDGDFSFAAINEEGTVQFLLEPPEVFSEGYDDEGTEDEPTGDQNDDSGDEGEDEANEESEDGENDESGESGENGEGGENDDSGGEGNEQGEETSAEGPDGGSGEGSPGDEPPLPDDDDIAIGQNLLSALEPQTTFSTSGTGLIRNVDDNDEIQQRIEDTRQRVNLVPSAPTAVASRSGTVTYSDPSFTLDNGATGYDMTLRFNVDFNNGTVDAGYLKLASGNDTWQGWFSGGIGRVNSNGDIGFQLGSTLTENQMSLAVHNNNPAKGVLNGTFYGASAQQVRGDFNMKDLVTEQSISGDYRVNEQ